MPEKEDKKKPSEEKSDDEIMMESLCKAKANFKAQLEKMRISRLGMKIDDRNIKLLLADITCHIKEFERKGIKQVEVKLEEPKLQPMPVQQ